MTEQVYGCVLPKSNENKKNDSTQIAKLELDSFVRYGEQIKAKTS